MEAVAGEPDFNDFLIFMASFDFSPAAEDKKSQFVNAEIAFLA
jgi:hypothetical protein